MNATYAMDEQNRFSVITNPRVVLNTLQQLVNERASITCKAARTPAHESFSSRVVKVEAENDVLVIQKPGANGWQYNLLPDSHVDVVSHLSSGTIKFNTAIFGLDEVDDPLFCELSLPQQLERKQLRVYYRVPLLRYESRLELQLAQGLLIEGNCIDISMGGVTGWFPGLEGRFTAGDAVSACHITIEPVSYTHLRAHET